MTASVELGPIRPPSEAYSLLIRVTRNCPWNRCRFCNVYKGQKFELRSVEEIKQDIMAIKEIHDEIETLARNSGNENDVQRIAAMVYNSPPDYVYSNVALWMYYGGKSAFLQDANTIIMRTDELVEVIKFLKETFPGIDRITSYGRSKTAAKKSLEELKALHDAGLSRIHVGLESGYDPLLKAMDKGVTAAEQIEGGKKVVAAGISLCDYVLLGLGGKEMWREHAIETARVLSAINPDFIRMRTLVVKQDMLIYDDVQNDDLIRETDEEIVDELKLLIENLDCSSNIISDHINNLLQEVTGKLPQDKEKMLAVINRFQSLPPEERIHWRVGRRMGVYTYLDELSDMGKRASVDGVISRISDGGDIDEQKIFGMMERFN